ncbi:hypothetical protein TD95_004453 [Thielaviopsis punctulata]|uniref:Mediator of RNA polymerase II transcription subunit 19 n=1 Tax=Thielaviopsis punctulata TaxID=72032 RepID=A0A0F4ZCF1_9PEZI|nr:hypothetical protein TD95_004453 [Thielaviopsis punctulata]
MSCHPQTPQSPSQLSAGQSDSCLSMPGSNNAIPTPAHSVNGGNSQQEPVMDGSLLKRKRPLDDAGDHMVKRLHTAAGSLGIEALHQDVGNKYRLLKAPIVAPKYRPCDDFFTMFNLEGLASDLAREKPNGEKNILRKSFKNQLKRLNIGGGYDTKKDQVEENDSESLLSLVRMPDDVWYANVVKEKDITQGIPPYVSAALTKVPALSRGKMRKEAWDSYVLGSYESGAGVHSESAPCSTPNTPGASGAGSRLRQTLDASKSRRGLKKRSYLETGFEDGHGDDETADGGYSTGEPDDRNVQKRRKKTLGNMSNSGNVRRQAYGPATGI